MLQHHRRGTASRAFALAVTVALASASASAQDVITTLVTKANASGTATLSTFAYDPTGPNGGTIYAAGFGSGAELRRIENLSGTQTVTQLVAQSEWTLFLRNNDRNATGGNPTPHGLLLNPVAVGGHAPFTLAVISDGGGVVKVSGSTRNDLTQRLYSYNVASGTGPFTSLVTQAQLAFASGLANPVTTGSNANFGRQFAYAGDGQSVYIIDTSVGYGGLYRANIATGTVSRLFADSQINTEVAVLSSGGTDTIFFQGSPATGNTGGIDKFTSSGTASGRSIHVAAAAIADFMETVPSGIDITSMAAGPGGELYFNNTSSTSPDRRGIFKVDSEGRLAKVVSRTERGTTLGLGSPNSNTTRMQPRTVEHPNGFDVTQIMYVESGTASLIAGAYDFKVGDFDRDDDVDMNDLTLLRAAVGVRGGPAVGPGSYKYDLNGNNVVDWKDVKILQTFLPGLRNGDANMDLAVDLLDLNIIRDNYSTTASGTGGKTWATGDFASMDPLATTYAANASDANMVNLVDLQVFATTWLSVLRRPTLTFADLDANGYTGLFRQDVITVFSVPEPSAVALSVAGLTAALAWRHRRQRESRFPLTKQERT
ncbi:MAG: hypothetical protein K8S94_03110 [Planctomycetia bacterium]|nr:hypothetical protein [Planctomycetia bacterium]